MAKLLINPTGTALPALCRPAHRTPQAETSNAASAWTKDASGVSLLSDGFTRDEFEASAVHRL